MILQSSSDFPGLLSSLVYPSKVNLAIYIDGKRPVNYDSSRPLIHIQPESHSISLHLFCPNSTFQWSYFNYFTADEGYVRDILNPFAVCPHTLFNQTLVGAFFGRRNAATEWALLQAEMGTGVGMEGGPSS